MHARTRATLNQLEQAAWFAYVGADDTKSAVVLSSLKDAMRSCGSPEWGSVCLEARNQLGVKVRKRSVERYNQWNNIIDDVSPTVAEIVRQKTEPIVQANKLPGVFRKAVELDITMICIESEYVDLCQPAFFSTLAGVYAKGHFPCGWKGKFPKRKLVIF